MGWLLALWLQQPVADLWPLAERVVVADVRGLAAEQTPRGIETRVELDVVRTLKGPRGSLTLRLPVGRVGGVEVWQSDVPQLRRGRYRFYVVGERLLGGVGGAVAIDAPPVSAIRPGFALNGASWAHHADPVEEPFRLNPSAFPVPVDSLRRVFRNALTVWNLEGMARARLAEGTDSDAFLFGEMDDDSNTTMFEARAPGVEVALTRHRSVDGEMQDCDIRVYGENRSGPIDWSWNAAGAPADHFDLQRTLTHELGHCLGLSHSAVDEAMMSRVLERGTGDEGRHLHADDRAGLLAIYGAPRLDAGTVDAAPPDAALPDAAPDA